MTAPLVLTTETNNCNSHPSFRFYHPDKGYVPFHCGSWRCSSCAPVKAENVTAEMVACAYKNDLSRHLTLTLDPKKVVGDPWVFIQKTWNKMRVYLWRLSRKRHRRLKWQKIVQIQPNTGLPHYHIMLSQFIPVKWAMKAWKAVGGGSVYIRYVKIDNIGGFVKGYFTKQVLGYIFPRRKRRYSTSQNIKLARPKQEGWKLMKWFPDPNYPKGGAFISVDRADFVDLEQRPAKPYYTSVGKLDNELR